MAKEIFVAYGVDVDAVGGWLGSYGGEDSPCDISRGMFSGEVGSPRLLNLFGRFGIKATWFIPGHSHENPIAMTPVQEEAVLDKCIELVTRLQGRKPLGYVAPWWEFSPVSNELLLKKGIL